MTLAAFIGGLSAALSCILVATTTLSLMASNDLVMPLLLRLELRRANREAPRAPPILALRRASIIIILALSWLAALAFQVAPIYAIGLVSLGALVQIAPRGTRRPRLGTRHGTRRDRRVRRRACSSGPYTVVVPAASNRTSPLALDGPLGIEAPRPTDLLGLNMAPFQQGLFWSLTINIAVYVALSLSRQARQNERLQADIFVRRKSTALTSYARTRSFSVSVGELIRTVARYLGQERATALFRDYLASREMGFDEGLEADAKLIKFTEHLIAAAVGAASLAHHRLAAARPS